MKRPVAEVVAVLQKVGQGLDKIFNWNPKSVEESEEAPRVYDLVNLAQRIIVFPTFLLYYGKFSIPKKVRLNGGKRYFTIRNKTLDFLDCPLFFLIFSCTFFVCSLIAPRFP